MAGSRPNEKVTAIPPASTRHPTRSTDALDGYATSNVPEVTSAMAASDSSYLEKIWNNCGAVSWNVAGGSAC